MITGQHSDLRKMRQGSIRLTATVFGSVKKALESLEADIWLGHWQLGEREEEKVRNERSETLLLKVLR